MNYLAHAYLSFQHPEILVGNMISDFVKGSKKFGYPETIQKGIQLHRVIDTFTDSHPATREARSFFHHAYRLYAGAFVDVVYDHFLANDNHIFPTPETLVSFSRSTYSMLENYTTLFPEQFQQLFPYMREQDWLYHYRFRDMIERSFSGVVRRAAYLTDAAPAAASFAKHYPALQACYHAFFPELKAFAFHHIQEYGPNGLS